MAVGLVKLLRREVDFRKASETQEALQCAEESVDSKWMNVVEDLQYRIFKEYREGSDASTNERVDITGTPAPRDCVLGQAQQNPPREPGRKLCS